MKRFLSLALVLLLCGGLVLPVQAEEVELSAMSAVLMDAETGQIVYAKEKDARVYPASITKILTVYLAATRCEGSEVITASHAAIDAVPKDSTNIAIDYGEQLTVEQAVYAAMLMSANDACNILAEHISGSMASFTDLMNTTAQSFGAKATHFENPSGLPSENHYTTAADFAKIAQNVIQNPKFLEYFSGVEYTIPPTNKKTEERNFVSKHRMMHMDKYAYLGVIGGKTGYTVQAKHTAVTYAEKDGKKWIAVIFGADSIGAQLKDTEALLRYGYEQVDRVTVTANMVGTKEWSGGTWVPTGSVSVYLPIGETAESLTYTFAEDGDPKVLVADKNGNLLGTLAVQNVETPKKGGGILTVLLRIVLCLVLIVLFALMHRRRKLKQNKKRRIQKKRDAIMGRSEKNQ